MQIKGGASYRYISILMVFIFTNLFVQMPAEPAASGRQEMITLRFAPKRGNTYRGTMEMGVVAQGMRMTTRMRTSMKREIDADNRISISQTIDSLRITYDGKPVIDSTLTPQYREDKYKEAGTVLPYLLNKPFPFVLDEYGKAASIPRAEDFLSTQNNNFDRFKTIYEQISQNLADVTLPFPEHPVTYGDSWYFAKKTESEFGAFWIEGFYAIEPKISEKDKIMLSVKARIIPLSPKNSIGEGRLSGSIVIEKDTGVLLEETIKTDMNVSSSYKRDSKIVTWITYRDDRTEPAWLEEKLTELNSSDFQEAMEYLRNGQDSEKTLLSELRLTKIKNEFFSRLYNGNHSLNIDHFKKSFTVSKSRISCDGWHLPAGTFIRADKPFMMNNNTQIVPDPVQYISKNQSWRKISGYYTQYELPSLFYGRFSDAFSNIPESGLNLRGDITVLVPDKTETFYITKNNTATATADGQIELIERGKDYALIAVSGKYAWAACFGNSVLFCIHRGLYEKKDLDKWDNSSMVYAIFTSGEEPVNVRLTYSFNKTDINIDLNQDLTPGSMRYFPENFDPGYSMTDKKTVEGYISVIKTENTNDSMPFSYEVSLPPYSMTLLAKLDFSNDICDALKNERVSVEYDPIQNTLIFNSGDNLAGKTFTIDYPVNIETKTYQIDKLSDDMTYSNNTLYVNRKFAFTPLISLCRNTMGIADGKFYPYMFFIHLKNKSGNTLLPAVSEDKEGIIKMSHLDTTVKIDEDRPVKWETVSVKFK